MSALMKLILIFSLIFSLISISPIGSCSTFYVRPNVVNYSSSILLTFTINNTNTSGMTGVSIYIYYCSGFCFVNGTNGTTSENSIFTQHWNEQYDKRFSEERFLGAWINKTNESVIKVGDIEQFWLNITLPDEYTQCNFNVALNYSDRASEQLSNFIKISSICSDGTIYSQCSSNKPLYCDNGNLVERCSQCGCPSIEQICQANESCITPNCTEKLIPVIDLPNGTSVLWGEPILWRGHVIDNCGNPVGNTTVKFQAYLDPNSYTRYPEPDNQSSGYYNYMFPTDRAPGWYRLSLFVSKDGYPDNSTSKENAFYIALAPTMSSPSVSRTGSCPDEFRFSVRVKDNDLNYNNISLRVRRWEGSDWGEWQIISCTYRNMLTNIWVDFDYRFENDTFPPGNYSYSFQTIDEFNYSNTVIGEDFTIDACGPCTENWTYGEWDPCIDNIQTRSSVDLNNCGTIDNRTSISRSCEVETPPSEPPSGGLPSPTSQNETVNESTILPEEPANIVIQNENISVKEITIEVKNTIKDVKINVMNFPEKPAQVIHSVIGIVYEYLEFNLTNITDNDIERATIGFRVSKTWLTDNNINKSTVRLNRYVNGTWHKMSTLLIGESLGYVYYEAEVPGFSYFAITGEQVLGVTQICVPDTKMCADNVLKRCNAEGTAWSDIAICISGCNNETLSCNPETVEDILWYSVAILLIVIIAVLIVYFIRKGHQEKSKNLT